MKRVNDRIPAGRLATVFLGAALVAITPRPAAPAPTGSSVAAPRDTATAARRDTSRSAVADTSHAVMPPDSLRAPADSSRSGPAIRDSAVVITTRAQPAKKGAAAPEPPYKIQADRMSGGRGPQGDVLFLERVTITRSGTRLNSDSGRYERATGMVHLEGHVRLRDSTTTITCDQASFSENEDRVDLNGLVVVVAEVLEPGQHFRRPVHQV